MPRVLVADGDPLIRRLLRRCLETDGYEVAEAEDGAGALRAIRENQAFDVLVTDQALASLTGVELIAIVQEIDPALPCLICTGKGDLELATVAMEAGAVTLIHHLGGEVPKSAVDWLLARARPAGGFLATPEAPVPDLLSTATALHALAAAHAAAAIGKGNGDRWDAANRPLIRCPLPGSCSCIKVQW